MAEDLSNLVLGKDIKVYIGTSPIAYATSHTLSVNGEEIDTSSKDSGGWKTSLTGQLSWQVTSDSLLSKATGDTSFKTLYASMIEKEPVTLKIGDMLTGSAIITSLEQTAANGEVATCSVTFSGQGELTEITGS